MHTRSYLWVLTLFIGLAHAEDKTAVLQPFKISVRFDQTAYQLSLDQKFLSYEEPGMRFLVPVKDCSRSITDRVARDYWKLIKANQTQENEEAPQDVRVYGSEREKPLLVARGSSFGNWLRALPARIPYFKAEARGLCKR